MRLSTKGQYGLRAAIDLARYGVNEPVPLSCIADRQEISERYLEQLMGLMKKAGLVISSRGVSGGYQLAQDPADVSVGDVLRALEGSLNPVDCVAYTEEGCSHADTCVTKYVWKRINESINQTVDEIKLAELVRESMKMDPDGGAKSPVCDHGKRGIRTNGKINLS